MSIPSAAVHQACVTHSSLPLPASCLNEKGKPGCAPPLPLPNPDPLPSLSPHSLHASHDRCSKQTGPVCRPIRMRCFTRRSLLSGRILLKGKQSSSTPIVRAGKRAPLSRGITRSPALFRLRHHCPHLLETATNYPAPSQKYVFRMILRLRLLYAFIRGTCDPGGQKWQRLNRRKKSPKPASSKWSS